MIGDIATIDGAIEALKNKGLALKIVEGLQNYLSCKIKFSDDKKCAWLEQPHLIKKLLYLVKHSHCNHGTVKSK